MESQMSLPRTTATHAEDLPHRFEGPSPSCCAKCERGFGDNIHSEAARELASESGEPMAREIGS
jgi:hypothetical protein